MLRIIIIGFLITMQTLAGCSRQTKERERGISKEMASDQANSVVASENNPDYKALTEQIIDTTSDENLLQVVFDNLIENLPADYEKKYERVMTWNKSRQTIYMISLLEAEVNNGGYNQFYYNSSGLFYKHLLEALRCIGANKFADLTQKANNTFEIEYEKITKYQDGTMEGFSKSYIDNPLNDLDTEFFELYSTENLQQIQVDFIRKYKTEFIGK